MPPRNKLKISKLPQLKNFEGYHYIRENCNRASGGTSIFTSNELFSSLLPLTTDLEAIAVTIWCPNKLTVCSIYIPPNYSLTEVELVNLIFQLPHPYILVGDFNAHNNLWGSNSTSGRGRTIENIINCSSSCLLNTGSNTHLNISFGSFSAIDLSLCDPKSAPLLTWHVEDDLYDSNHFPIVISSDEPPNQQISTRTYWQLKSANWDSYMSQTETTLSSLVFF